MRRYQGRTFVRETIHVCGEFLDADIYPVHQAPGKRRGKCRPTTEIQKKLNQRNAERKLIRLVHNNFTENDIALHITYEDGRMPPDEDSAKKILARYIRKLRALFKDRGIELKYISTTEVGKTTGRVHHHMILTGGIDRDTLEKMWGYGYANSKRLQFGREGVAGLACYMAKEAGQYRRWSCSRNLERPEPAQIDGRLHKADQEQLADAIDNGTIHQVMEEQYPGYELVDAEVIRNEVNRGIYIHMVMRRKKGKMKAERGRMLC